MYLCQLTIVQVLSLILGRPVILRVTSFHMRVIFFVDSFFATTHVSPYPMQKHMHTTYQDPTIYYGHLQVCRALFGHGLQSQHVVH